MSSFPFIDLYLNRIKSFDPEKGLRRIWTVFIFLIMLFTIIYVPLDCGFDLIHNFSLKNANFIIYYSFLGFYIFDILINFNTAFYSKGCIIFDKKQIFKQYFKNSFFIDFSNYFIINNKYFYS